MFLCKLFRRKASSNAIFGIKQFVPEDVCLKCQGCCRFREEFGVWLPCLLDEEALALKKSNFSYSWYRKVYKCLLTTENRLSVNGVDRKLSPKAIFLQDKKIIPAFSKEEGIFFCPFLNRKENKCVIYGQRLFDCRLYPFVINRKGEKTYLAADLNCDFIKINFKTLGFNKYVEYLLGLLNSETYRNVLKNNPQIIQLYPEVVDLAELGV